ncbi:hypothetical protein E0W68_01255 [Flavobacterium salilacus subsp. salilacus]|uniref:HYC_CC_PP family protein n=1 Tax=Flavobacterium TaxID=237 RepID=UPI001074FB29|nr:MULTISPECIES: hypothetical protein [Flavobacterium]KAF2519885.1 hypothetical protein E0W68_01255 [Flavobacterium salilacus subsp. salilacus]MBE1614209.1 hypothetical protein [Flavobacterium sp. SaA2.13]NDI97708.1 hypothetical protein [Flavobacterium salilacus subsp. altitudinum]
MQLKKHISFVLSFLILVANMGLALNVHYCKGQISEVSFAYKVQEPCNDHHAKEARACCGMAQDSHKSCCKNDLVKLKDKADNLIIVKSLQLDLVNFCIINEWKPIAFYGTTPVVKKQTPAFYCETNAPPLFKLYCRYTLYA